MTLIRDSFNGLLWYEDEKGIKHLVQKPDGIIDKITDKIFGMIL